MLIFPLDGRLDEDAFYAYLLQALHAEGLHCPRGLRVHANPNPFRAAVTGSA